MVLATQYIDPLFHSFYYMQYVAIFFQTYAFGELILVSFLIFRLNIFYLTVEKLRGFAEKKYTLVSSGAEIEQAYLDSKTDASSRIESLEITKRVVSTGQCHFTPF